MRINEDSTRANLERMAIGTGTGGQIPEGSTASKGVAPAFNVPLSTTQICRNGSWNGHSLSRERKTRRAFGSWPELPGRTSPCASVVATGGAKFVGVKPVWALNAVVKWLWLAKPVSKAIVVRGFWSNFGAT